MNNSAGAAPPDVLLGQAITHLQQGRLDEAESIFRRILRDNPEHADANHLLGIIALQRGAYDIAVELIARAIQCNPRASMFYSNLGNALYRQGRFQEALSAIEQAIRLGSNVPETFYNGGNALQALGRLNESLAAYEHAIRLRPDYLDAHYSRCAVLLGLGRAQDAERGYRRVLELNPRHAGACNNLAVTLVGLGRYEEALTFCERALSLIPDYAQAHNCRADALYHLSRLEEAFAENDKAIAIDPGNADAYFNRANMLLSAGLIAEAEENYNRALSLNPDGADLHSNLLFVRAARAELSTEAMLEELRQWDRAHGQEGRMAVLPMRVKALLSGRRLRVGYVSPSFRNSVVSFFFEPLLAAHDKARFEIFCYASFAESRADETTQRLRGLAEHWRYVGDLSDAGLAQRIHEDGIDILVDLSGHTSHNRLKVFTYRPAPVQVTYLGFFASTGLGAMDYWITDEVIHPQDTVELASEKIYRLPRCWVCYRPSDRAPAVSPCPTADERVVFGVFSHLSKLTPAVIATWSEILKRLPGSRLLIMDRALGDPWVRALLQEKFAAQEIPPERLLLRKGAPYSQYFATYAEVDIVLDPFPRTGGTTTAEALWMGVPVVCLAGQRYVERISASKLSALALTELIAASRTEYIEKAISLAHDPARRRELRESLRDRVAQSPLGDAAGLARAMESAYTTLWEHALAQPGS